MNSIELTSSKANKGDWKKIDLRLSDHLGLIERENAAKRFRLFLSSPYPERREPRFLVMFDQLFKRYAGTGSVRLSALVKQVYPEGKVTNHRLLKDFNCLCDFITDFVAYERLGNQPAELERQRTYALQHRGLPEAYLAAQKAWQAAADALPQGSHAAYHRWAAAHAGYYSLDINGANFDAPAFDRVHELALVLYKLHEKVYQTELAKDRLGRPQPARTPLSSAPTPDSELIDFYERYNRLYERTEPELTSYFNLKEDFRHKGQRFDREHRICLMMSLTNYLRALKTHGHPNLELIKREIEYWSEWLVEDPMAADILPDLTRFNILNRFHGLLSAHKIESARKFIDCCIVYIPAHHRNTVRVETDIAITFHQSAYLEVVEAIKAYNGTVLKRNRELYYGDRLRLHFYNVRSLIHLGFDQPDFEYDFAADTACKSFEKYLERNRDMCGQGAYSTRHSDFAAVCRVFINYLMADSFKRTTRKIKKEIAKYGDNLISREWFEKLLRKIEASEKEREPSSAG